MEAVVQRQKKEKILTFTHAAARTKVMMRTTADRDAPNSWSRGEKVPVTGREFKLLLLLWCEPGKQGLTACKKERKKERSHLAPVLSDVTSRTSQKLHKTTFHYRCRLL